MQEPRIIKLRQRTPNFQSTPIAKSLNYQGKSFGESSPAMYTTTLPSYQNGDINSITIQKQRRELELLIQELKERDKELNELVHSHHQQLVSWEADRLHIRNLEKQLNKYKSEYKKRHEQCKLLKERWKMARSGATVKHQELQSTQINLKKVSEKANISSNQVDELTVKNMSLQNSIADLTAQVSLLTSKEQQLASCLRLKDKDISNANQRIDELTTKLQRTNNILQEYKKENTNSKIELEKSRNENIKYRTDLQKLQSDAQNQNVTPNDASVEQQNSLQQEILMLQKELLLAGEREKRKDCLLESARSQHERTQMELNQLRKLYNSAVNTSMHQSDDLDERLSVFTLSEHDQATTTAADKTTDDDVLDSSFSSVLLSSITQQKSLEGRIQHENENEKEAGGNRANDTLGSLTSQDLGEMFTEELRVEDEVVQNTWQPGDEIVTKIVNDLSDENLSPTSRLHRLLTESRQMINDLAQSPSFGMKYSSETITNDFNGNV